MILCFSGTGNSRYAARLLSDMTGDRLVNLSSEMLINLASEPITLNPGERLIWVFPTYSWGVPPIIANYIKQVDITNGSSASHFMVTTCGDDIGLCHSMWRRLISRRQWNDVATFSVIMPNSYVCLPGFDTDPSDVEKRKIEGARSRISVIADKISKGERIDDVTKGRFPWVKTKLIYPIFKSTMMSPSRFKVDSSLCISCGKCAAVCPLSNINMVTGQPVRGDDCTMCLACYHVCPRHAINYGSSTLHKKQYHTLITNKQTYGS